METVIPEEKLQKVVWNQKRKGLETVILYVDKLEKSSTNREVRAENSEYGQE